MVYLIPLDFKVEKNECFICPTGVGKGKQFCMPII